MKREWLHKPADSMSLLTITPCNVACQYRRIVRLASRRARRAQFVYDVDMPGMGIGATSSWKGSAFPVWPDPSPESLMLRSKAERAKRVNEP
jgi:hypothetical protein